MPLSPEELAALQLPLPSGDVGGGGMAQPPPVQDPSQSAYQSFLAKQNQDTSELKAAQDAANATRGSFGFKAGNFLLGFGGAPAEQIAQRYAQAGQPVTDLLARREAARQGTTDTGSSVDLQTKLRGNALAGQAMDPNSPVSQRVQQLWVKMGLVSPEAARHIAAADADLALKLGQQGIEKLSKEAEARAQAATAAKTTAETAQIAPNATVERAVKTAEVGKVGAETGKTQAETEKLKMETGGQVAPGYVPTSGVQHTPEESKDFRNHWAATQTINDNVDEILKTLNDKNFIADPKKRAQVQPKLAKLIFAVKEAAAIRGLPQADIQQIEKLFGDPTKLSVANLTGLSQNATRMKTFRDMANQELDNLATSRGYQRAGGARGPGGGTVDVISPEGKRGSVPAEKLDAAIKKGFRVAGR